MFNTETPEKPQPRRWLSVELKVIDVADGKVPSPGSYSEQKLVEQKLAVPIDDLVRATGEVSATIVSLVDQAERIIPASKPEAQPDPVIVELEALRAEVAALSPGRDAPRTARQGADRPDSGMF